MAALFGHSPRHNVDRKLSNHQRQRQSVALLGISPETQVVQLSVGMRSGDGAERVPIYEPFSRDCVWQRRYEQDYHRRVLYGALLQFGASDILPNGEPRQVRNVSGGNC